MNRKTLTYVFAVMLIVACICGVFGFAACVEDEVPEGATAWERLDAKPELYPEYPRPEEDATTPNFSGYVSAGDVVVSDGYTLKPITEDMDAWTAYQTMRENQKNVIEKAQVTTTASQIDVQVTGATGVLSIAKGKHLDIVQYASWMKADMEDGSYYDQTISQMDQIGISYLESLTSLFGAWSKSSYDASTDTYSSQTGGKGSMAPDETAPAGITALWMGTPSTWNSSEVTYNESQAKFDKTVRVTSNVDNADYKVYTGDDKKLGDYRSSENSKNNDSLGNKVIYVEFKGSDGNFGAGTWYVWDENCWDYDQNKYVPQYVGFDRDRHYKALPSRGDGISNYMVTDDTFDMSKSKITPKEIDGHTYYVIDVVLTDAVVDWDIITGGELGSLQGSIIDFVAFDTEHGGFQRELTLRYEVWDTGVIRRAIRTYSIATDEAVNEDKPSDEVKNYQISAILGLTAYGSATNNQIQEFAYSGDAVSVANADGTLTDLYNFERGAALSKMEKIGVGVGCGAAVLIALIVTLVVLAKKGIIGKKKNKKAAETAGEGADAENKE